MPKKKAPAGVRPAMPGLRYVGEGRWLAGVPARDLAPSEVAALDPGALIRSGLYTEAASATAADEQSADSGEEHNDG